MAVRNRPGHGGARPVTASASRSARGDLASSVARSKVMAIRFVAHLSALNVARRAGLAARLRDAERADPSDAARSDAARSEVQAAVVDPAVVGRDVDVRPFLASLAELTRDAAAGDATLASRADDVVRALLIHAHPAYRADFQRLYAPVAADIGFDRLLLG